MRGRRQSGFELPAARARGQAGRVTDHFRSILPRTGTDRPPAVRTRRKRGQGGLDLGSHFHDAQEGKVSAAGRGCQGVIPRGVTLYVDGPYLAGRGATTTVSTVPTARAGQARAR